MRASVCVRVYVRACVCVVGGVLGASLLVCVTYADCLSVGSGPALCAGEGGGVDAGACGRLVSLLARLQGPRGPM